MSGYLREGERIGAYTLERELGRGLSASTWLAEREGGGKAALKILDLNETKAWTAVDLFHRESEALAGLGHPGIPRFLDSFEAEYPGGLRLALAMEYVEGPSLEAYAREAGRIPEPRIEAILAGLCDILDYLGSLRPPVVHRDINPRNVILRPDGSVSLVDFSGVQEAVRSSLHPGATLVGSAGYTPLEQVAGKASPRSDRFGAAATAVFLLTGRNPADLPSRNLRIDLSGLVEPSPALAAVLDSWLDPDADHRALSPREAAAMLRGETKAPAGRSRAGNPSPAPSPLPSDSSVTMEEREDGIRVVIPPAGLSRGKSGMRGGFALVWLAFIAFWTFMVLRMRAPVFFPMFSIPFWLVGIFMVKKTVLPSFVTTELSLGRGGLVHRSSFPGSDRTDSWPLADIGKIGLADAAIALQGEKSHEITIETGSRVLRVGSSLSEAELRCLAERLEATRRRLKGRD